MFLDIENKPYDWNKYWSLTLFTVVYAIVCWILTYFLLYIPVSWAVHHFLEGRDQIIWTLSEHNIVYGIVNSILTNLLLFYFIVYVIWLYWLSRYDNFWLYKWINKLIYHFNKIVKWFLPKEETIK